MKRVKALGQVSLFLYEKMPVPALLKVLELGLAKFDTTREPDTTRHEISKLWVKA